MTSAHKTLFDLMVEEGAHLLMEGLYAHGMVPHPFLRREAELLQVCEEVERDWLKGEIESPLLKDVLWEVSRRLRARECKLDQRDEDTSR